MRTEKKKEVREKIDSRLKKIKYRFYQSEIRFVSHDEEGLLETVKKIRYNCSVIISLLTGGKRKKAVAIRKRKTRRAVK